MKREFSSVLDAWKDTPNRKPLVIRGLRQTGKTWSVRDFAARKFGGRLLEVNFEFSDAWRSVFEGDSNPVRICGELELLSGKVLSQGDTLLFLDEIQLCPKALSALRFFYEMKPELPVIAAGSLLDFALDSVQFPVGRVQFAELSPMSFAEYLEATGSTRLAEIVRRPATKLPDSVHAKLLDEVKTYSFVGGLPECVKTWSENSSFTAVREIQRNLVIAFEQDFGKYPEKMEASTLQEIWRAANASVARQISYAGLSREHSGTTNKKALELLSKARLLRLSAAASAAKFPFDLDVTPRIKPYAGDIGLYQFLSGRPADEFLRESDLLNIYNGALAEQFVAQELAASLGNGEPHWWKRDAKNAQAEVDFMVGLNGGVQPIEVKSGGAGRLRSVHQLLKENPSVRDAIVLSSASFGELPEQRIRFVPIYYAGSLAVAPGRGAMD